MCDWGHLKPGVAGTIYRLHPHHHGVNLQAQALCVWQACLTTFSFKMPFLVISFELWSANCTKPLKASWANRECSFLKACCLYTAHQNWWLAGNVVSLVMGGVICYVWSVLAPEDYDFVSMKHIKLVEDEDSGGKHGFSDVSILLRISNKSSTSWLIEAYKKPLTIFSILSIIILPMCIWHVICNQQCRSLVQQCFHNIRLLWYWPWHQDMNFCVICRCRLRRHQ